jgi:hypothetical protein
MSGYLDACKKRADLIKTNSSWQKHKSLSHKSVEMCLRFICQCQAKFVISTLGAKSHLIDT